MMMLRIAAPTVKTIAETSSGDCGLITVGIICLAFALACHTGGR